MSLLSFELDFEATLQQFQIDQADPIQLDIQESRKILASAIANPAISLEALGDITRIFCKNETPQHAALIGRVSWLCKNERIKRICTFKQFLPGKYPPQEPVQFLATCSHTADAVQAAVIAHQEPFPLISNMRLFEEWEKHVSSTMLENRDLTLSRAPEFCEVRMPPHSSTEPTLLSPSQRDSSEPEPNSPTCLGTPFILPPEGTFGIEIDSSSGSLDRVAEGLDVMCSLGDQTVFLKKEKLLEFLRRNGIQNAESYSITSLAQIVTTLANECVKRNTSRERICEVVRRISLGVKLLPKLDIAPSSTPLPLLTQLINEYRSRRYVDDIELPLDDTSVFLASGYIQNGVTDEERRLAHERDKELLLRVVTENNRRFSATIQNVSPEDGGLIDQIVTVEGQELRVRADLHSDLQSLLAFLSMPTTDESDPDLILLGDYTDRGFNDIEILTLLLIARMERPDKIHLIRGNHEDPPVQQQYSLDGDWFNTPQNRDLFSDCYKTFSLAFCVSATPKIETQPYEPQNVHFSHGLFNPGTDLAPLLESTKTTLVAPQNVQPSERVYYDISEAQKVKQKEAFAQIKRINPIAMRSFGYPWFDVKPFTGPTREGCSFGLSPEDVQAYGRYAGHKCPIKHFVRGHNHQFAEFSVDQHGRRTGERKVLITTLPVGTIGGAYKQIIGPQTVQGLVLRTAVKVRDWKKQLIVSENDGAAAVFRVDPTVFSMYDKTM